MSRNCFRMFSDGYSGLASPLGGGGGGGGAFFPVVASNSPDALRKLTLSSFYLSYGELVAVPSNRK